MWPWVRALLIRAARAAARAADPEPVRVGNVTGSHAGLRHPGWVNHTGQAACTLVRPARLFVPEGLLSAALTGHAVVLVSARGSLLRWRRAVPHHAGDAERHGRGAGVGWSTARTCPRKSKSSAAVPLLADVSGLAPRCCTPGRRAIWAVWRCGGTWTRWPPARASHQAQTALTCRLSRSRTDWDTHRARWGFRRCIPCPPARWLRIRAPGRMMQTRRVGHRGTGRPTRGAGGPWRDRARQQPGFARPSPCSG